MYLIWSLAVADLVAAAHVIQWFSKVLCGAVDLLER